MSGSKVTITYSDPCPGEFVKEEHIFNPGIICEEDIFTVQHEAQVESFYHEALAEGEDICSRESFISDPLAVKSGDLEQPIFGIKEEDSYFKDNSFEAVFVSQEEDFCESDANAVDPLATGKEDGSKRESFVINNEVKKEDTTHLCVTEEENATYSKEVMVAFFLSDNNCKDREDEHSYAKVFSITSSEAKRSGQQAIIGRKKHQIFGESGVAVSQLHNDDLCPSHSKNSIKSKPRNKSRNSRSIRHTLPSYVVFSVNHVNENSQLLSPIKRNQEVPTASQVGKKHLQNVIHEDRCVVEGRGKPYTCVCAHCGFKCASKINLQKHITKHKCAKAFKCSNCEYRCSRKGHLTAHMSIHTGVKPFQCSLCEYRCSQKGNLNIHMLTHTGVKPIQCSLCEYKCAKKGTLKNHMFLHTGVKPLQCSLCKFRCCEKRILRGHMFTHPNVIPLQCSRCKFRCSEKRILKRHMLTHSDAKPFQCSFCEYRSFEKGIFNRHILTHTGVKPFQCSHCEYKCSQKGNLKRHMLTHTAVK